jgi:hypothetical protein
MPISCAPNLRNVKKKWQKHLFEQDNRIMRTRGQTIDGLAPAELHLGLVRLCSRTSMRPSVDSNL